MITEIILVILVIWNIILSYYLFNMLYVKYESLENVLIKHMAGYSPDEIRAMSVEGMKRIIEKRRVKQ